MLVLANCINLVGYMLTHLMAMHRLPLGQMLLGLVNSQPMATCSPERLALVGGWQWTVTARAGWHYQRDQGAIEDADIQGE